MAPVLPTKPRSTITDAAERLEIVIPSPKNWFLFLFLPVWLYGWQMGEFSVIRELLSGRMMSPFILVWLAAWTVGGGFAIFALVWGALGREIISLSRNTLQIRYAIGSLSRSKEFEMTQVKNMRVSPQLHDFRRTGYNWWGYGGGTVAFDYSFKTYRFGHGISEAEAAYLLEKMRKRFPSLFR